MYTIDISSLLYYLNCCELLQGFYESIPKQFDIVKIIIERYINNRVRGEQESLMIDLFEEIDALVNQYYGYNYYTYSNLSENIFDIIMKTMKFCDDIIFTMTDHGGFKEVQDFTFYRWIDDHTFIIMGT